MKKRSKNLTEGNIKKQLYTLTWPMLFGMMGMVIFNLADTYFVGPYEVVQNLGATIEYEYYNSDNGIYVYQNGLLTKENDLYDYDMPAADVPLISQLRDHL